MGKKVKRWLSCGMLIVLLTMPAGAHADFSDDAGMGALAVLADIVYIPVKLVYATLGGITGGFAYVLTGGNYSVAEKIWIPSLGGHYVITAEQIRGNQPIYFSGTATP